MKKNVRNNVCVTVALVCLALVVLFAWLGCVGSSTALLILSMAAGAGFVVAVNCLTNGRPDGTELKVAAAAAKQPIFSPPSSRQGQGPRLAPAARFRRESNG